MIAPIILNTAVEMRSMLAEAANPLRWGVAKKSPLGYIRVMGVSHRLPDTFAHAGSCPQCCYVLPPMREASKAYFEQGFVTCSQCHVPVDLWDVVLMHALAMPSVAVMSLELLGASRTSFVKDIEDGKYHEIDLTSIGIPEDATVLQVGYTPQGGGVFPLEWHGNVPERRIVGTTLRLIGRAAQGHGPVSPVSIWVVWVHQEAADGWPYLVNAFEAVISRHFDRVIVPAQSAVEISIIPIVKDLLEKHASTDRVKQFVEDELSFGHVINVFLPFVAGQMGITKLPDKIRGSLNKLRRLRNALVHRGVGGSKVTPEDALEALCAAVFGFEYAVYARSRLLAR